MQNPFKIATKTIGLFPLFLFWFVQGTFRTQSVRWIVVIIAISMGISLAVSINIVNKSAISEFNHSTNILMGDASYQIKAKSGFFNETVYEEFLGIKNRFGVSEISPVLELSVVTKDNKKLNILGLDFFKVLKTTPIFLAIPEDFEKQTKSKKSYFPENKLSVFDESSIFLSPTTREKLNVSLGDSLPVYYGGEKLFFNVAGSLSNSVGNNIGVIDIAAFQSFFKLYGKLSRLDFKVSDNNNFEQSKSLVNKFLNDSSYKYKLELVDLSASLKKNNNLTKAYYVNLSVLALVALFTGTFLIYSVLSLSVQQQTSQFALLRTIGISKVELVSIVLSMGFLLSFIGSTLGVIFGISIAKILLSTLNANLGANLVFQNTSKLYINWLTIFSFWTLGVFVGLMASVIPALKISKISTKSIFTLSSKKKFFYLNLSPLVFCALIVSACLLLLIPPYNSVPIASYFSIAIVLFAFIGIIPNVSLVFFRSFKKSFLNFSLQKSWAWLGINRLTNTSGDVGPIISSVVASVALTISILVMVSSFKNSVISWLDKLLMADLYGTVTKDSGYLNIDEGVRQKILLIRGIRKIELSKSFPISLDSSKVDVKMIVRQLKHEESSKKLFLIGEKLTAKNVPRDISFSDNKILIYVSESMRQLYDFKLGSSIILPFPNENFSRVTIAGFYRDYSNQHGSLVVRESDFKSVTGMINLNNLAVWLETNSDPSEVVISLKKLGGILKEMNFKSATNIREISLEIFDRTFYVAYLLGFIALFISIFSILCTYISQAKIREKEFSLLLHLGASKSNILLQTSFESGFLCFLGVFWGTIAGIIISLILIFVVNPQSFHWTMNFTFPMGYILWIGFFLTSAGIFFSRIAVKSQLNKTQLGNVLREDGASSV